MNRLNLLPRPQLSLGFGVFKDVIKKGLEPKATTDLCSKYKLLIFLWGSLPTSQLF